MSNQLAPLLVGPLLAWGLLACGDEAKPDPGPDAPVRTGNARKPDPQPAPPPPPPLDVARMQKALNCPPEAEDGPCEVLANFGDCVDWNPVIASGEGRWLGRGFEVENGIPKPEIHMMRSRRVPTNEVGAGQLGAKIAIARLPTDDEGLVTTAKKAVETYRMGDIAIPSSP
ncbi:MAG: hypothetical protein AAGA56_15925, partial [Myxococcota bacterium]